MHLILYGILILCLCFDCPNGEVCYLENANNCKDSFKDARYIFYDVNPSEGFNLRRDVYMRLAIFMHQSREKNWKMVLPPWPHLYHWQTNSISQYQLKWDNFFNVTSLKLFAPVLEMHEFFKELGSNSFMLDTVYVLQHYKDAFSQKNWNWNDKWSFENCNKLPAYEKSQNLFSGWFWGYKNISAKNIKCTSFQGGASLLNDLLKSSSDKYVMLDNAEVVLHENFGDKKYWECRRSMKFAEPLLQVAHRFIKQVLNYSNIEDDIIRKTEFTKNYTKGGSYLCVHLRRRDFVAGRPDEVPTIEYAAKQISEKLLSLNLNTVFFATDASHQEIIELKSSLPNYTIVQYIPSAQSLLKYKDGGVAIIDQIICSHARYFIGSYESTFSFRIQEEREIMGFLENTTFNRLCGSNKKCTQPSKWKIQF